MIRTRCPFCKALAEHEVLSYESDAQEEVQLEVQCSTRGCGAVFFEDLAVGFAV